MLSTGNKMTPLRPGGRDAPPARMSRRLAESRELDKARMQALARYGRRHLKRGEVLYRATDKFASTYVVHSGFFKTVQMLTERCHQVIRFDMPGDVMGFEAIGGTAHLCTAVALEDGDVFVIPYPLLSDGGHDGLPMQRQLHQVMGREINRQHVTMMTLGTMSARDRLARFLLNLSERFAGLGYSPSEFHLRMTRQDIGSYLGLTMETVSRILSSLQQANLIAVDHRRIRILDAASLAELSEPPSMDRLHGRGGLAPLTETPHHAAG